MWKVLEFVKLPVFSAPDASSLGVTINTFVRIYTLFSGVWPLQLASGVSPVANLAVPVTSARVASQPV
jgi:hypothetical protein